MGLRVAVVGASSQVGGRVVAELLRRGDAVTAFSRTDRFDPAAPGMWRRLPAPDAASESLNPGNETIESWIFVAHVWVLPDYFALMKAYGARRLVAVSSTSQFTKVESSVSAERDVAARLATGEEKVAAWCRDNGVTWTVLRPTLIYGGGRDRNIEAVSRFARRFRFFPLLGAASGLRQPIHYEDVAGACVAALASDRTANRAYNISGGEVLSFREMVRRVFAQLGQRAVMVPIPLALIKFGVAMARLVPSLRHWSPAMAERMNKDMVFDHADAERDFGFAPRRFVLTDRDVQPG